jgi:protein-S-isoprenylcysteine O-methyltransferase Ste14
MLEVAARAIPLVGAILFVAIGFVWRAWLQYRRFGHTGIVLFRSGNWATNLRGASLLLLFVLLSAAAAAYAIDPDALDAVAFAAPPTGAAAVLLGAVLVFGGIALMVVAQLDMGASWRVGIEEGVRPGLVTRGVFRVSRNPIYVAVLMALVGFTILLPTWPIALALLAASVGIRRQVLEEETYLLRTYGAEYERYAGTVGRFVPGLGRLRPARG